MYFFNQNGCSCPEIYDPVCGIDGNDYSNACHADCLSVAVDCQGQCPCSPTTVASLDFIPVQVIRQYNVHVQHFGLVLAFRSSLEKLTSIKGQLRPVPKE